MQRCWFGCCANKGASSEIQVLADLRLLFPDTHPPCTHVCIHSHRHEYMAIKHSSTIYQRNNMCHMCMYVCMYVGTYVCMYLCMYVCMYVRMYKFMYVCMYVYIYDIKLCIYISIYRERDRHIVLYIYVLYIYVCIMMYYIYTSYTIDIHIYTHQNMLK